MNGVSASMLPPSHTTASTLGKASVQQYWGYNIPDTGVLRLLTIDYGCLPWTLAIMDVLCECYASVTVCHSALQNEANFSYCMHSINPLFSIVTSTTTTITISTITITTITTITITTIGNFTPRIIIDEPYIVHRCRHSVKPDPPLPLPAEPYFQR